MTLNCSISYDSRLTTHIVNRCVRRASYLRYLALLHRSIFVIR